MWLWLMVSTQPSWALVLLRGRSSVHLPSSQGSLETCGRNHGDKALCVWITAPPVPPLLVPISPKLVGEESYSSVMD